MLRHAPPRALLWLCRDAGRARRALLGGALQGRQEGFGTLFYPNKEEYCGEVLNGQMQGRGQYTYRNGDIFQGSWCATLRCASGERDTRNAMRAIARCGAAAHSAACLRRRLRSIADPCAQAALHADGSNVWGACRENGSRRGEGRMRFKNGAYADRPTTQSSEPLPLAHSRSTA